MTKNSIFDVGRTLNSPLVFVILIFIGIFAPYNHKKYWKNLSKAFEKHFERDSLLEKNKVFNQDSSICRETGTFLVLKLDIVFITLWDNPMQDGSVIIIFELSKQTAMINADKICAGSDDCRVWKRRI